MKTQDKKAFFPFSDWQYDVTNGDTKLGYDDWVNHNFEAWHENLIQTAVRAIETGSSEEQCIAFIEAQYGVSSENEARDIVSLAGNRF